MDRCRHIGRWKNEQQGLIVGAAYNLIRFDEAQSPGEFA